VCVCVGVSLLIVCGADSLTRQLTELPISAASAAGCCCCCCCWSDLYPPGDAWPQVFASIIHVCQLTTTLSRWRAPVITSTCSAWDVIGLFAWGTCKKMQYTQMQTYTERNWPRGLWNWHTCVCCLVFDHFDPQL